MKKLVLLSIAALAISTVAVRAADGKALYEKDCTKCHGADGKGGTVMGKKLGARDYSDPKVQDSVTDAAITKAIKEGVTKDGKSVMKPTEGVSDDEAKALVAYMRSLKK